MSIVKVVQRLRKGLQSGNNESVKLENVNCQIEANVKVTQMSTIPKCQSDANAKVWYRTEHVSKMQPSKLGNEQCLVN